jgi:hypothetical protein
MYPSRTYQILAVISHTLPIIVAIIMVTVAVTRYAR